MNYHPNPFNRNDCNAMRAEASWRRWDAMKRRLMTNHKLKILDVGCSEGFFAIKAAALGHEVIAVDNDEKALAKAREYGHALHVEFRHTENLMREIDRLVEKGIKFDVIFYMSVHHHIFEQMNQFRAGLLLRKLSSICDEMIFDMGQPDENPNEDMVGWWGIIPRWTEPRLGIIDYVSRNSEFAGVEIISSTIMHGAHRWLYRFTKREIEIPDILHFGDDAYVVDRNSMMSKNGKFKTNACYYKVHNWKGELFWVKELRYNEFWYHYDAEKRAAYEWHVSQKLEKRGISKCLFPMAISRSRLLYPYCDWPNLYETKEEITCADDIIETARKIDTCFRDIVSKNELQYDLNPNNILYRNGDYRFIDFKMAICDYEQRMAELKEFLKKHASGVSTSSGVSMP